MENVHRSIEEQVRGLRDRTSARMDWRILSDLFERLEETETIRPAFAPARLWRTTMKNKRIRLAVAAVVALGTLIPLGYGATRAIKKIIYTSSATASFDYPEDNQSYVVSRSVSVTHSDDVTPEQAQARLKEFAQLYREGKAEQIKPGVWKATLADGTEFAFAGSDPARAGTDVEFTEQEKEQLRQQFDEVNELRKAGKGERTFWKEIEEDGVRTRLYHVRYTLSSGQVVTLCEGEEVK